MPGGPYAILVTAATDTAEPTTLALANDLLSAISKLVTSIDVQIDSGVPNLVIFDEAGLNPYSVLVPAAGLQWDAKAFRIATGKAILNPLDLSLIAIWGAASPVVAVTYTI